MGKWTSHHNTFFTKLRMLKEVESSVLREWWHRYMLLCKYVLRAVIATLRRRLAVKSGSDYYARLLLEYHNYWKVAPIQMSAIWMRRRGLAGGTGQRERHHPALSAALQKKCAVVRSTTPRRECNPAFNKEEWEALGGRDFREGDFIKVGEHF